MEIKTNKGKKATGIAIGCNDLLGQRAVVIRATIPSTQATQNGKAPMQSYSPFWSFRSLISYSNKFIF